MSIGTESSGQLINPNTDNVHNPFTVYINAGGRGTRLNGVYEPDESIGITKALIVLGEDEDPVLDYHVRRALLVGARNVVVGAGDHRNVAEYVNERFKDNSRVFVSLVEEQRGTAGDLCWTFEKFPELFDETIITVNCDTLLDIDERHLLNTHLAKDSQLTLTTTESSNTPNPGAIYVDSGGKIVYNEEAFSELQSLEGVLWERRVSSCGMLAVSRALIDNFTQQVGYETSTSLFRELMYYSLKQGNAFAYDNEDRFFIDFGTPDSLSKVLDRPRVLKNLLSRFTEFVEVA